MTIQCVVDYKLLQNNGSFCCWHIFYNNL